MKIEWNERGLPTEIHVSWWEAIGIIVILSTIFGAFAVV